MLWFVACSGLSQSGKDSKVKGTQKRWRGAGKRKKKEGRSDDLGAWNRICGLRFTFVLACSQTLYFLFKVRRARVIKYKPQGIYWPPAQGGRDEERRKYTFFIFLSCALRSFSCAREPADVFERTKRKKKQRVCTGYVCTATPRSRLEVWEVSVYRYRKVFFTLKHHNPPFERLQYVLELFCLLII